MRRRPPNPRRRTESGQVKLLTLVLLAALVAGGYYLVVWGPLFVDHVAVKQRCTEAVNSTWRKRNPGATREAFLRKVHAIARERVDVGGLTETRPAIAPAREDLLVELDRSVEPPVLSIDVVYPRTVRLPLLDRDHTFWFSHRCEQDLGEVRWE